MKNIPIVVLVLGMLLATFGVLHVRTADAEENYVAQMQADEMTVMMAAHDQMAFWEAALDASVETDNPPLTFLSLMKNAEWSHQAIEIWAKRYVNIDIVEMYGEVTEAYETLASL